MIRRCTYSKDDSYHLYGKIGITVCKEWEKFDPFCDWALENGYDETAPYGKCTIDRIDGSKGYSPDNCRWVDMKTQANNTRVNVIINAFGKSQTPSMWEMETGVSASRIRERIKLGWTPEEAVSIPVLGRCEHYYRKTHRVGIEKTT